MRIPVGDVLRSLVAPDSFLGRILAALKGITITKGGTTIELDQNPSPLEGSRFDSKPHEIEPPAVGGPRR